MVDGTSISDFRKVLSMVVLFKLVHVGFHNATSTNLDFVFVLQHMKNGGANGRNNKNEKNQIVQF